ncbi:AI-2E family transporter [Pseudonocardia terrae]|uniref:AI-2E family transporter n=1 Tax=Pseudonocardia terrae TaxID=2905831 RepID=UPI0027DFA829|nr:AI-2E family transporter [Pseudonocardia terrae]
MPCHGRTILLGLAALVVAAAGVKAAAWLIGPVFLALVVATMVSPLQRRLRRLGWLTGDATEANTVLASVLARLAELGVGPEQLRAVLSSFDTNRLVSLVTGLLVGLGGLAADLVFLLTLLLFLIAESGGAGARLAELSTDRAPLATALGGFARSTRRFIAVTTVIGLVTGAVDAVFLWAVGVPLAVLWGVLVFLTNYIPYLGFWIGLHPLRSWRCWSAAGHCCWWCRGCSSWSTSSSPPWYSRTTSVTTSTRTPAGRRPGSVGSGRPPTCRAKDLNSTTVELLPWSARHRRTGAVEPVRTAPTGADRQGETIMTVELNHTIVASKDKVAGAKFLAELLGLPDPQPFGPFQVLALAHGLSLDFASTDEEIHPQHYAFLVTETEFDEIFARITDQDIRYWAEPHPPHGEGTINTRDGGRGLYFASPDGHYLEILTRPYGSGG